MPVHRIGLLRGETVYALADELEAWQRAMESRGDGGAEVAAEPAGPGAAPEAPSGPDLLRASSDGRARPPRSERGQRARLAVPATVAMILLAVAGWAVRSAFSTHPGSGSGGPLAQPARADIEGDALVVYDSAGHSLWRHRFDFRLTPRAYQDERRAGRDPVLIDDLDGDGSQEVLFVAEPDQIGPNGALYCFDRSGALRFVYRAQYRVTYGPLKCVPPWRPSFAKAFGKPGRPHRIWFVSFHLKEFPTVVDELDPKGHVLGHYWSDGQVMTLTEATIGRRGRRRRSPATTSARTARPVRRSRFSCSPRSMRRWRSAATRRSKRPPPTPTDRSPSCWSMAPAG